MESCFVIKKLGYSLVNFHIQDYALSSLCIIIHIKWNGDIRYQASAIR